jgi:hypothetical protein
MADTDEGRATTEIDGGARPTTKVDEAPPDAPAAAEVPAPQPTKTRVHYYLVALLVAAVIGPLVFYLGFWRYEPTAKFHIPAGTSMAVRFDAHELFQFTPFREHLLPIFATETAAPRRARVRGETGVDLERDTREVIVATADAKAWVVLGGGRYQSARRGRFIDGYQRAMEVDAANGVWAVQGDVVAGPGGVSVAQADDGTLILATSTDVAKAALPATDDYRELYLASSGAVSFSIRRAAFQHLAAKHRGTMPEAAVLDRIELATGWLKLTDGISKLSLELSAAGDVAPETMRAEVEALFAVLSKRAADDDDFAVLLPLFTTATVKPRPGGVMVQAKMTRKEAEAATKKLADRLRAFL